MLGKAEQGSDPLSAVSFFLQLFIFKDGYFLLKTIWQLVIIADNCFFFFPLLFFNFFLIFNLSNITHSQHHLLSNYMKVYKGNECFSF